MKRVLYVDDIRTPNWFGDEVIVARNYEQALKNLLIDQFDVVDLDHDLGEEKTGYDIVKFIIENQIEVKTIAIHTANPVGRDNMRQLVEHYLDCHIILY
ncbi:MAG: hypothetical protein IKB70_03535 [Bacilli bacterium]|nr:hypothetical protein [Bacilli bacterium]